MKFHFNSVRRTAVIVRTRKSDKGEFWIQIDASKFAEFELFEFEISIFDCILLSK